jgi:hypothetical protein
MPARLTHVGPIASNMRAMDRMECEALGRSPKDALRNGLRCSQDAWTATVDGRPGAMMGVVSDGLLSGSARVWFLGTDEVYRHGRDLLTYGPLFVERWLLAFRELHNIVAKDNVQAIRLLGRWGFELAVGDDVEHGGVAFTSFRIRRKAEMVPVAGIEPASVPYEGTVLPLN